MPGKVFQERLGNRYGHQGVLRLDALGSDAEGGRAPHGLEMGHDVRGAVAEGPDADARRYPEAPDNGNTAGAPAPQGGPISPLLANLFLHYGFDAWMTREYLGISFER